MTEIEWYECTDPHVLIAHVQSQVSEGQLRRICCSFVRRVWDLLSDARSRTAVEVSEAFAQNCVSLEELTECRKAAYQAHLEIGSEDWRTPPARAASAAFKVANEELRLVFNAIDAAASATSDPQSERVAQCGIIRANICNPFQNPPPNA